MMVRMPAMSGSEVKVGDGLRKRTEGGRTLAGVGFERFHAVATPAIPC